jgi:exodeoxyribonuclease VII large subunit
MNEMIRERTIFSLFEVAQNIQKTLADRFSASIWVKAEMNRINHYPQSGHCYPDLVEKKEGKIVAAIRSTIWKDDYQRINENFLRVLKEPLKDGINILFSAKVTYHPLYGLSLRILDIDPSYSLGEIEREKLQTIERLKKEGVFQANKSAVLPLLPKRIAVISVRTSNGYSDFMNVIERNEWGYRIFHMLFPALLQGDHAVDSISGQLSVIRQLRHHFDAVAIIRGGGGDVGLSCYNDYRLSREVALFPIPVLTGIGHSTNETVTEMVAYRNAITPTELADFLIQKFHDFAGPVQKAAEVIRNGYSRQIRTEETKILNAVRYFRSVTGSRLIKSRHEVQELLRSLGSQSAFMLERLNEKHIRYSFLSLRKGVRNCMVNSRERIETARMNFSWRIRQFIQLEQSSLDNAGRNIELVDPLSVMKRGYSMTLAEGKILKSTDPVREGTRLRTILPDGEILSLATSVRKKKKI